MIEHLYRYPFASQLAEASGQTRLRLAAETPETDTDEPVFLRADLRFPVEAARGLRAVSEIVGSRFYVPPSMLAKILREADPVVTVGSEAVRFEGFSACCSTYARLDLKNDALRVETRRRGTTNVDFGPELRAALGSVAPGTPIDLAIGAEHVEVTSDGKHVVERRVPLPQRWLKGFAEVQSHLANMKPSLRLGKVAAHRFLRALPSGKTDHLMWVSATGANATISQREGSGAIPLRGAHRLKVLEGMVHLSKALAVFVNRGNGSSAWCLDFGHQSFWLVLNAEPWRGFSGDGGLLRHLAKETDSGSVAAVCAQLAWQDVVDAEDIRAKTGLSEEETQHALSHLASSGQLGYDLDAGAYFHRSLPFDGVALRRQNPRLKAAEVLLSEGAVELCSSHVNVRSKDVVHRVVLDEDGWQCTCPWYAKNKHARGMCKHALAAEIFLEDQ